MSVVDGSPVVTSMIPHPTRWSEVRSLKAVPGMTNDEKAALHNSLRVLKDKYLDESKVYTDQDSDKLKNLVDEVCAQCPFVIQRYENAWPIEAYLRSRLSSSASASRRSGGHRSQRSYKSTRSKVKARVASQVVPQESQDEDMQDELESSPEPEEPLRSHRQLRVEPSQQDSSPSVEARMRAHARAQATSASSRTSQRESLTPPPHVSNTAQSTQSWSPRAPQSRSSSEDASQNVQSDASESAPSRAVLQIVTMVHHASPAAPAPPSSESDSTSTLVNQAETGEGAVRNFLHSLIQPMDALLPAFLQAGIHDMPSLRNLAALPEESQLKLLRSDMQLNILQSRIILHGLSQLP